MVIYQHWYDTRINFSVFDIIFIIVILIFAYIFSRAVGTRKSAKEPLYRYLSNALTVKILMGIIFAVITILFYPGDTFEYYKIVNSLNSLFFVDSSKYFEILSKGNQPEFLSYFSAETGYPARYMWRDPNSIFVTRIYSPFMFLTFNSFIASTIVAAIIGFTGLWKLFVMFNRIYPNMEKQFAIAILYFPSTLFWSSGILKDTLTISAIGWIMYCFYNFVILKKFNPKYLVAIIIASIIIINIKSYIFVALIPGLIVWLFFKQLNSIKSGVVKFVVAPLLVIVAVFGLSVIMSSVSGSLGEYGDIDSTIKKAQVTQQDLTRSEQYGENYYDIGKFEATPMGVISKAPIAIVSGIFRPFIWEVTNPFILMAALESLFLMGFLVYALFKTGVFKFFKNIFADPILIFSFSFILIFGFGVGLATANFGALVRYKIPLLPFFTAGLYILIDRAKKKIESKDQISVEDNILQSS